MEYIGEFIAKVVYVYAGRFVFGQDFARDRDQFPLWKRSILWVFCLVVVIAAFCGPVLLYRHLAKA